MADKNYIVINDFICKESGDVVSKGSVYKADKEREIELRAAGVIGKEATKEDMAASKEASQADPEKESGGDPNVSNPPDSKNVVQNTEG
ncbi:hypothetical protein [Paenibacillus lutimineralis]|uniref:Uncharacterized protein n=1 Tax=Paenibacillus lutimineralis TaxID=2707005 RepID=A0A3Q9IBV6_9BACL|nr:hypothetical protein [Paenibacillus lutimineralis]AZS17396.1 hypothetical protein EI981_25225 [Paenibacillus lutimineralis]